MPHANPRRGLALYAAREDGFTMIELLIVVIIIAILAAVSIPVYIGLQNSAKKSAMATDVSTTKTNVAAAFAEDDNFSTSLVEDSHTPKDETVTVYEADGTTPLPDGAPEQNFEVVATDGNDLGGYTISYDAVTGQTTNSTGTVAAPSASSTGSTSSSTPGSSSGSTTSGGANTGTSSSSSSSSLTEPTGYETYSNKVLIDTYTGDTSAVSDPDPSTGSSLSDVVN